MAKAKATDGSRNTETDAQKRSRVAKERAFNVALNGLPDEASAAEELMWVRNHPLMISHARSPSTEPIVLGARDITKAKHGAAPSRSAAMTLQYWVNQPDAFFKEMLGVDKKAMGKAEEAGDVGDVEAAKTPPVKRIDELLSHLAATCGTDAPDEG